jgi:hypothetical protein
MERQEGPQTHLTIAFLRGLYIGNKLHRLEGIQTPLNIALFRGLYLCNKMDRPIIKATLR